MKFTIVGIALALSTAAITANAFGSATTRPSQATRSAFVHNSASSSIIRTTITPINSLSSLSMTLSQETNSAQRKLGGTTICPEIHLTPELSSTNEVAVFAFGWFWHPQVKLDAMDGIERTVVGYTGGSKLDPEYSNIMDSTEAVLVEYDPKVLSYNDILNVWETMSASGYRYPSKGQYRTAIWYLNDEQKQAAVNKLASLNEKYIDGKVYVDIEAANPFYKAEEYHQNYIAKARARH